MKSTLLFLFLSASMLAAGQSVVINEVYGAGGNSGALFTNDYIELFNSATLSVDLTGWSVQYASAGGTGTWQMTPLTGTIEPGRHFLIQLAAGSGNGQPLPLPDVAGTIAMAATAGKIALVQSLTPLSGACPFNLLIVDQVGYGGSSTCFEGNAPAPSPSTSSAIRRIPDGMDTQQNGADFRIGVPQPQHSFPRSQSVSFMPVGNRVYGNSPFVLTASASSGLPVTFSSGDVTVASLSEGEVTIHRAGTTILTASQAGNATYSPAEVAQTLHVAKASLEASALPSSRMEGESNPVFALIYSGFVNGDQAGLLDEVPVASCSAAAGSPPGDYPIVLQGGQDDNYEFILRESILTVLPKASLPQPLPFLRSPDMTSVGIGLSPRLASVIIPGATSYTFELSDRADFSLVVATSTGPRSQVVGGLRPGTLYYVRVRTDLSTSWGSVRTFRTAASLEVTFLREPVDGSSGVSWLPRLITHELGAAQYVFQLDRDENFPDPVEFVAGSATVDVTSPLNYLTRYFCRVRTSLAPNDWGPVRSFTTGHPLQASYVRSPAPGATDVSTETRMTLNVVPGAVTYFVSLEPQQPQGPEEVIERQSRSFVVWLAPSTTYRVRVRSNLTEEWGPVSTFTTAGRPDISHMVSPVSGSVDVMPSPMISAKPLFGATSYTIEVNTASDFSGPGESKTSASRSMRFRLLEGQRYYVRVQTDVRPGEWGPAGTFTTRLLMLAGSKETGVSARRLPLYEEASDTVAEAPEQAGEWRPYPNPFQTEIRIPAAQEVRQLTVLDAQGRVVESRSIPPGEETRLGQYWASGIYVLHLTGESSRKIFRVVKR